MISPHGMGARNSRKMCPPGSGGQTLKPEVSAGHPEVTVSSSGLRALLA